MLNNGLINKDSLGVLELYDKLFSNNDKFEQKIRITQLKVQPGKEKLDKDGNIILDSFGVPCKWDDRFYMTYVCVNGGGSHICSISQDLFVTLQEQVVYIAKGYVEYKIYGDNYNSMLERNKPKKVALIAVCNKIIRYLKNNYFRD